MPAAGVRVAAMLASAAPDSETGASVLASVSETDAAGNFRLENIPAGRYYIVAGLQEAPSYFPGTAQRSDASIVTIEPGAITENLLLRLVRFPGVRVSGRVLDPGKISGPLILFHVDRRESFDQKEIATDGSFEFIRVPPGRYAISAGAAPFLWSSRDVVVENDSVEGVEGLELTVASGGGTVTGRAEVTGGGPLPDFWLALQGAEGWGYVRAGVSNQRDGTFWVNLPDGEYNVRTAALPPGYGVETLSYGATDLMQQPLRRVGAPQWISARFSVSTDFPRVSVAGRLEGLENLHRATGIPRIGLSGGGMAGLFEVPVAPDGSFEFSGIFPGAYRILVPDLGPQDLQVGVAGIRDLSYSVAPVRHVTGRVVVDGESGSVPYFDIGFVEASKDVERFAQRFPDGGFDSVLPDGLHRIHLNVWNTAYGVKSMTRDGVDLPDGVLTIAGSDIGDLLIVLELVVPKVSVRGRALDFGARQSEIPDRIVLSGQRESIETAVAPDGAFEFTGIVPGTYTLRASGYAPESIAVPAQDVDGIDIRLRRYLQVHSRLRIEGESPDSDAPGISLVLVPQFDSGDPRVRQRLFSAVASTNVAEGDYRIEVEGLPSNLYRIESILHGAADLRSTPLRVAADTVSEPLTVTLSAIPGASPWRRIAGRLTGAWEAASPSPQVIVLTAAAGGQFEAPIAADGAFEWPRVLPGNYGVYTRPAILDMPSMRIIVFDADVTGVEIAIPSRREVHGRITVEGGLPLPPASLTVWLNAVAGAPPPPGMTYGDAGRMTIPLDLRSDGSFTVLLPEGVHRAEIGGFPTRYYAVQSMAYGGDDMFREPFRVDETPREIAVAFAALQPAGWVRIGGYVPGRSNLPEAVQVTLQGRDSTMTLSTVLAADGSFEFPAVPPDTYEFGTAPATAAMPQQVVQAVSGVDVAGFELIVPALRDVGVQVRMEGEGSRPAFQLIVRLNGKAEGYHVISTPAIGLMTPLEWQCVGDVCTRGFPRTLLYPLYPFSADAFRLQMPEGSHTVELEGLPAGYRLQSLTQGDADLLSQPLQIAGETISDIVVTLAAED